MATKTSTLHTRLPASDSDVLWSAERYATRLFERYVPMVKECTGRPVVSTEVLEAERAVAYAFLLKPRYPGTEKIVMTFDFDDTTTTCTEGVKTAHDLFPSLLPRDIEQEGKDLFHVAIRLLYQEARVLPRDRTPPVRYSPLFELTAITALLEELESQGAVRLQQKMALSPSPKEWARSYLATIIPRVANYIQQPTSSDAPFVERNPSAAFLLSDQLPMSISPDVWQIYQHHMVHNQMPASEYHLHDLPEDVRHMYLTFGLAPLQMEKVLSALRHLGEAGGRMPDEIIVQEVGHKSPIHKRVMQKFPGSKFIHVDDSFQQFDGLDPSEDDLILVHARRPGIKNQHEATPKRPGVREVDMTTTRHSDILRNAFSPEP